MSKTRWIVYHRNSVVSRSDISILSLPLTIKKARELLYTITTEKCGVVFKNLTRLSEKHPSPSLLARWSLVLGPIVAWMRRLGFPEMESS